MAECAGQQDAFKMALEWEDEDEVVVKVEAVDEDGEEEEHLDAADPDDLLSTEDWTRVADDITRKCYVNKRARSSHVEPRPVVEEISFSVQDDEYLLSKDVEIEPDEDDEEDEPYSLIDLDEKKARDENRAKQLMGYYRESEDDDGGSSSSSDDDNRFDTNFSEEVCAPPEDVVSANEVDGERGSLNTEGEIRPVLRVVSEPVETVNTCSVSDIQVRRTGEERTLAVNAPRSEVPSVSLQVPMPMKKIIYLKQVPKEFVLKNKGVIKQLPGKVIVQKSGSERSLENVSGVALNKLPPKTLCYNQGVTTAVTSSVVDQLNQKRSYLRENASLVRVMQKPQPSVALKDVPEFMRFVIRGRTSQVATAIKQKRSRQPVDPNQVFKCPTCNNEFKKRKHLLVHMKIHSGVRKPPTKACPECGKLFPDNTQLRIHSRVHTGETPYTCPLCEKKFKHQTSLARHSLFHTKQRPFPCDLCEKTYRTKSDLVNHKRTHTLERPFACQTCGKRFHDRCAKNTHERIHAEKKYKCAICASTFAQATTLKGHMVTHTNERPFECAQCGLRFKSRVVLRSHMRVHTAAKTFKCDYCKQLFTEKRTLMRHIYTHAEKPFPCAFCKRWYFREDRWREHVKTHSDVSRPFGCIACPKRYASKGYLKLHVMKAHQHIHEISEETVKGGDLPVSETTVEAGDLPVVKRKAGRPRHLHVQEISKVTVEVGDLPVVKRKVGRPRHLHIQEISKVTVEVGDLPVVKRKAGRPRKIKVESEIKVEIEEEDVTPQIVGRFECDICKATFKSKLLMSSHIRTIHASFAVRRKYKKRVKVGVKLQIEAGGALECKLCGQSFRHRSTLARHHKYSCN